MSSGKRKREDSPEGCREMAEADRGKAAASDNAHMRACLERSAETWSARARLLDRLQANFEARAVANAGKSWRDSHAEGGHRG